MFVFKMQWMRLHSVVGLAALRTFRQLKAWLEGRGVWTCLAKICVFLNLHQRLTKEGRSRQVGHAGSGLI